MAKDGDVGYRHPPKSTRFKKGQSGNTRGRPKGTRNLSTDLDGVLRRPVTVREGGKQRTISGQEALLVSLYQKAVGGDVSAIKALLSMIEKLGSPEARAREEKALTKDDESVVEAFLRRQQVLPPEGEE
jgi:hypothetical protein